jgi:hypothetical protein
MQVDQSIIQFEKSPEHGMKQITHTSDPTNLKEAIKSWITV